MTLVEFTAEVGRIAPELRSLTYRFTKDRDESKDLVQDTLLRALHYRRLYRRDTNLKGWLFTIMRNIYINNFNKTRLERATRDRTRDLPFLNIADDYTYRCPDGSAIMDEMWKEVNSIRKELREPFTMHLAGYLYEDIAEKLKIPLGTVKSRIFHARKEIQKKLPGYR